MIWWVTLGLTSFPEMMVVDDEDTKVLIMNKAKTVAAMPYSCRGLFTLRRSSFFH